jgi:uncharacterized protein YegL
MLRRPLLVFFALLVSITSDAAPYACADNCVVVILDDSGSMGRQMASGGSRMRAAIDASKAVLKQLPADTTVGLLTLNTRGQESHWIIPVGKLQENPSSIDNLEIISAAGGTPLGHFMQVAANELLRLRANDRYGSYRLLVITDGEATDQELLQAYLPQILSRGLILNVIGVDMANDHSLAMSAHTYRRAADVQSLIAAISEVFAETTSTDQDAQDDFDLLAGLPDGLAEEVIQAISQVNNQPIEVLVQSSHAGQAFSSPPVGSSASSASSTDSKFIHLFTGMTCCCGSSFAAFLVAFILLVTVLGKRGRRQL